MDLNAFLRDHTEEDAAPASTRIRITDKDLQARLDFYAEHDAEFEATDEHMEALRAIFQEHRNVFVTGGAGTGKTTFIRSVVMPELDFRNLHWAVTATTGIAGSHLEGKTLNSFFGIGLGPDWKEFYPRKMTEFLDGVLAGKITPNPQDMCAEEREAWYTMFFDEWMNDPTIKPHIRDGVIARLRAHEVVLIDEISMCLGCATLGYLDFMLKKLRGDERPFGNLQMIFIGDFAQLPGVEERDDFSRPDWAFLAPCWDAGKVKAVELTRVFRQGEPEFIRFLNNIRLGVMTAEDRNYAAKFVRRNMTQEETRLYPFLVPLNKQAKSINAGALANYPAPTQPLTAEFVIVPQLQKMKPWEVNAEEHVVRALEKSLRLVSKTIFVRVGTPVMFTVNTTSYVNGTLGFVREVNIHPRTQENPDDEDNVVIGIPGKDGKEEREVVLRRKTYSRFREQDPTLTVRVPVGFNAENDKMLPQDISLYPTVRQFPLIPATAITIHKCVDRSTLVPTNVGMKRIADICDSRAMPRVAGLTEFCESQEPFVGGEELGYKITTSRGFSVVVSERHPMLRLCDDGEAWVNAPDLRVGDALRMRGATHSYGSGNLPDYDVEKTNYNNSECDYKLPAVLTEDLSWLLGILVGDGCVSDKRDGRIDVTSMDWEVLNRFADIMRSEFGLVATLKPKSTSRARVSYVHCWGVRRWLIWLGLSHATAGDKSIPKVILEGSEQQQQAFLRGYFDADGGVNTAVHVTSSSRRLIEEVHLLLLNMGVVGTIATMKASWRINITGVDIIKYRDVVGFTIPHKIAACDLRAPDHRKIPKLQSGFYPRELGKFTATSLRAELRSVYPAPKGLGFGDYQPWAWYLSRVARGKAHLTDAHLAAMQRDLPLCVTAGDVSAKVFSEASAGCFVDEIISIERVTGDMRDICVPDGHAFVGNGFVNHNSQGMSMDRAILALSRSFAAGQVYVGLSRLRSPEGMVLTDADFEAKVDAYVMEYYRTIREQRELGVVPV